MRRKPEAGALVLGHGPQSLQRQRARDPASFVEPSGRRTPIALQRLDSGGDDVPEDLEVDRAALGPELVALLEKAGRLVEIASLVKQFAKRRAGQPGGVGMTAAGPL